MTLRDASALAQGVARRRFKGVRRLTCVEIQALFAVGHIGDQDAGASRLRFNIHRGENIAPHQSIFST